MTSQVAAFPAPPAEAGAYQPFWDAVQAGRLELPRCEDCGRWVWHPSPGCPGCGGGRIRWQAVAGTGTLFTYTVVHRAFLPGLRLERPYVAGLVELDGAPGARLVGIIDAAPDEVGVGMRLRVRFDLVGDWRRPVFEQMEVPASRPG